MLFKSGAVPATVIPILYRELSFHKPLSRPDISGRGEKVKRKSGKPGDLPSICNNSKLSGEGLTL
jgi:hypothetical protein